MPFYDEWTINKRRDVSFIILSAILAFSFWSSAFGVPGFVRWSLYLVAAIAAVPAVKNAKETGMDFSVALVPWICIAVVALSSLSHFFWAFATNAYE